MKSKAKKKNTGREFLMLTDLLVLLARKLVTIHVLFVYFIYFSALVSVFVCANQTYVLCITRIDVIV